MLDNNPNAGGKSNGREGNSRQGLLERDDSECTEVEVGDGMMIDKRILQFKILVYD